MKNYFKKTSTALISIVVVISTFVANSTIVKANNQTNLSAATSNINNNKNGTFIPFRSDFVNYITQNASAKSSEIQKIWMQLFHEETNWNQNQSYYTNGFGSWSDKYYCNYVGIDGETRSSKGTTVTFNPSFDGFLYSTLTCNEDFIVNWINENPTVFAKYCNEAKKHPVFADGIMAITAYADSSKNYLGNGKDAANNLFEYGSKTSGDKHQGFGKGPTWTNSGSRRDWHDIDVLKVLGSRWKDLNDTQKKWVCTYIPWLVDDYIASGSGAVASMNNSPDLYNLMAESGYGMTKTQVNQEFFNHCVASSDAAVGNLIVNGANTYGYEWTLRTNDVYTNSDMVIIWASDADCDYNSGWVGGRGNGFGDDDYDWLAYQICFNTDPFYSNLRNLVSGNATTYSQMQDWLMRYYANNPSANPALSEAFQKAGTTESITLSQFSVGGCGQLGIATSTWDCSGHHDSSSAVSYNKPVGVNAIKLQVNSGSPQFTYSKSLNYKVYDSSNGNVFVQGSASENTIINIPASHIWSSTVVVEVSGSVFQGHIGHNSGGGCWGTATGAFAVERGFSQFWIPYHTIIGEFTYANFDHCIAHGHQYTVSGYSWNSDHTCCVARMICPNCGKAYDVLDRNIEVSNYPDRVVYTAKFSHLGCAQKSETVLKNTSSQSKTFSAEHLSGSTSGIGAGTCSLSSEKIGDNPKKISISVNASVTTVKVMNKYGQELDSRNLSTGAPTSSELSAVFDLSGLPDKKLEGCYVIINMQTTVQDYATNGNYAGVVWGPYSLNYIKLDY